MNADETRQALHEQVVVVTTTIWAEPGVVDPAACAANTDYLLDHGITTLVCAGGVGEHDRISIDQQKDLVAEIGSLVQDRDTPICLGTGLGRTVERVRALAPALGKAGVDYAMLLPPRTVDPQAQLDYYDQVFALLSDNGVWPMLYTRPEYPLDLSVMESLLERHRVPGVKLGPSDNLPVHAALVERLGYDQTAWLCGVAGWWMPAYHAMGMARGMSSGIANAFPDRPRALLDRILSGTFRRDAEFWTFVKIEELRRTGPVTSSLVIKAMQEMVGLYGGMDGDGREMPTEATKAVQQVLEGAGWLD